MVKIPIPEEFEKEIEHLRDTQIPRCVKCKKDFINATDTITKKISKYLWQSNCSCFKKKLILSRG